MRTTITYQCGVDEHISQARVYLAHLRFTKMLSLTGQDRTCLDALVTLGEIARKNLLESDRAIVQGGLFMVPNYLKSPPLSGEAIRRVVRRASQEEELLYKLHENGEEERVDVAQQIWQSAREHTATIQTEVSTELTAQSLWQLYAEGTQAHNLLLRADDL